MKPSKLKRIAVLCAGWFGAGALAFGQTPSWMKPDFVVTSLALDPATPGPGGVFIATVTVLNQGDIPGDAGAVRMWVSKSGNAKAGEAGDAEQSAGLLDVGESRTLTFALTAPTKLSTHHARAFVDADNAAAEKSEGNNQLSVTYTPTALPSWMKPDYVVTLLELQPAAPAAGETFVATATVLNQGDIPGDAGVVRMWASMPTNASAGEAGDAEQAAGILAAGESRTLAFALTAPAAAGTHHARAFVDADNAAEEKSDGNNQMAATYDLAVPGGEALPVAVELRDLEQRYDGSPRSVTVVTDPDRVPVKVLYRAEPQPMAGEEGPASEEPPVDVGVYAVEARVDGPGYVGSTNGVLLVMPAEAAVELRDLLQVYDGSPRNVTVATDPAGLPVEVTYDGLSGAPVAAGSYAVSASVVDANYSGSASGTLAVSKAAQTIGFPPIDDQPTSATVGLAATASSGLPASFAVTSGPATISEGTNLAFTGTGMVSIGASQGGDANWNPAPVVIRTFRVEGPRPGPELSSSSVNVREEGEGRFFIRLDRAPTGSVAVTVSHSSGDANLTVRSGATRTFTAANWSAWQVVTLAAAADGNRLDETATFRVSAPGVADRVVVATALDKDIGENVALASGGTAIAGTKATKPEWTIDGAHTSSANYGYTTWTNRSSPGTMTLDLGDPTEVRRIRLLNWDWGYRVHQYRIDSSLDGSNWVSMVDAGAGEHHGWEDWAVANVTSRYLRFTGLSNSANQYVCVAEWEVHGWRGPLPRPEVSAARVNVREAGEGRFHVRLDRAPEEAIAVTVSRTSGDASLAIQSGADLTFGPENWNVWQAVTLTAPADGNIDDEETIFQVSAPGVSNRIVTASSLDDDIGVNLALASGGGSISGGTDSARLIDGVHAEAANAGTLAWAAVPPEAMTLDLGSAATVTRIRLLNWDWAHRTQRYRIESSLDGTAWSMLVDASAGGHIGWEDREGAVAPIRYLRITGLSNSAGSSVSFAEWEVYGTRGTAPRPEVSDPYVNVRESGEGRFFVRLDRAPAANVAVSVARRAGATNLWVQSGAALTFAPTNWNAWQLVTLASGDDTNSIGEMALFRVSAAGVADRFVEATALDDDIGENRARASLGSTISGTFVYTPERAIDGIHTSSANYGYPVWTNVPPGTMTLDLKEETTVARIRLLNWDWGYRVHQYRIESSLDGAAWSAVVDASAGEHHGWEDWAVDNQPIRYLRFTALSNSANRYVCIAEWEVYAAEQQPPQGQQPGLVTWPMLPATNINVREGGEGRFHVRLDRLPDRNISVSVSRIGGSTNLGVQTGAAMTFTPANWSAWQAVTLAAGEDANSDNETATFRITVQGGEDRYVEATALDDDIGENLALSSRGSSISGTQVYSPERAINGLHTVNTNYGYVVWTNPAAPGTMTLDLKAATAVSRMRLLNWDWSQRVHRYRIESSLDGAVWHPMVNAGAEDHWGWEDWAVTNALARYLRFTGLSNSANRFVCIAQWEVYGAQAQLPPPALSATNVNVREAGEGRFHVRLDSEPAGNVAVAVSPVAGSPSFSVKSGGTLTFTPANWSVWQAVTLGAGEDANSANETAIFRISAPGLADGFVTATALDDDIGPNLALASSGTTISGTQAYAPERAINGVHASSTNYGYVAWTSAPPGTLTMDLKVATKVSRIRVLNWDWTFRVHQYRIESSLDGATWSPLVEAGAGGHSGWEDWAAGNVSARYLRFTGLSNSANRFVCLAQWEVYGTIRPAPAISKTEVNVRENGEGRFYVRLDRAPAVDTAVTIARATGVANLSVKSGGTLTFTPANWNSWQAVTLWASDDADAADGMATFSVGIPGFAPQIVTAYELDDDIGENLALASGGSTISGGWVPHQAIDGIHTSSWNNGYTDWTGVPPETMTMDLHAAMTVTRIRLLNWDWSNSGQRYRIESSLDGTTWTMLADASAGARQGWDDWAVADQSIRYLRFTGLTNSSSPFVMIAEWEVYGARPSARRSLAAAMGGSSAPGSVADPVGASVPVTVVTSDDVAPVYESGWAAVDGDPETAWEGQKAGGGYILVEFQPALALSSLEVDLAEDSLANIQYLYSADAENWQPLPDDLMDVPVPLHYLWLVFPDDGTSAVPRVIEIRPNP